MSSKPRRITRKETPFFVGSPYSIVNPRKLEHGFRMINVLKGMRFQLSGFYCISRADSGPLEQPS